jgi:methyltransferase (TIGR00027 family)
MAGAPVPPARHLVQNAAHENLGRAGHGARPDRHQQGDQRTGGAHAAALPYPQVARYQRQGGIDEAANFNCGAREVAGPLHDRSHVSESTKPALHGISKTSIYVAAGRALGAREPDQAVRNPDVLAERLLGDPAAIDIDHPSVRALSLDYEEAMRDVEVASNVRMMTVRTRFIDEALERAVRAGASQVIILGAGFDSHAYRCQELLADVRVFEVDRPATQALKRQRVLHILGAPPRNLVYVPIDFQHEDLADVLTRHGYDRTQQTFFILEGVTMYLPQEAAHSTLRFVAGHRPGSGIVFDFVYQPMIDMIAKIDLANVPAAAKPFVERFLKLTSNEPWVFGLPAAGEREFLGQFGLELREALTIGGEASVARNLTRADGTQVGAEAIAAARARMAERAQAAGQSAPDSQQAPTERTQEQQRLMAYQLAEAVVS